ncbi:hypothetical protein [Streptomyces sp. NPDC001530]|uniref:hypothetical protein n=1 Tax=Streptomyces sp. NPDC001530 TaxID=3364582 RepID=UPI0036A27B41
MAKPRSPAPARFRDPRHTKYDFTESIVVRCPRCERIAHVRPVPDGEGQGTRPCFRAPRRLTCHGCGLSRQTDSERVSLWRSSVGPALDPYFRAPLWLQTETRHGWLWAYNLEHLAFLRQFVAASLRERAPWYDIGQKMTVVARLPVWIKSAKNRDEVLRAVERIRATVSAG